MIPARDKATTDILRTYSWVREDTLRQTLDTRNEAVQVWGAEANEVARVGGAVAWKGQVAEVVETRGGGPGA